MHLRCIFEMSHIQCFRDISKRANMQVSETSPGKLIKDVSSERSLRYLRFSQRPLWFASETTSLGLQIKGFFGCLFIYLRVFKYFCQTNIESYSELALSYKFIWDTFTRKKRFYTKCILYVSWLDCFHDFNFFIGLLTLSNI